MSNTLFLFWQSLGDLIASSFALYDYHLQYPNQILYISPVNKIKHPVAERICLFYDQSWIKIYNNQSIDKIYNIHPDNFYISVHQQKQTVIQMFYTRIK